jgi:hypothetical protein
MSTTVLVVFCLLRAFAWAGLLVWIGLVVLCWLVTDSHAETSIHQGIIASQVAAALILGYAAARAFTHGLTEVEKVIKDYME